MFYSYLVSSSPRFNWGYKLPYYTKDKFLTKEQIFQNFEGDEELLKYIPNNPNLQNIPRELLLSILAPVNM